MIKYLFTLLLAAYTVCLAAQISLVVRVQNDDFQLCPDQKVRLRALATYDANGADVNPTSSHYEWTFSNGHTESGTGLWLSSELSFAAAQQIDFVCTVDDGEGNKGRFEGQLRVAALPSLELSSPDKSLCIAEKITLNANVSPGSANGHTHSYSDLIWTGPGVPLNAGGTVSFSPIRTAGEQSYTMRLLDDYGCIHTKSIEIPGVKADFEIPAEDERQAQHLLRITNKCENATEITWKILNQREAELASITGPEALQPEISYLLERPGLYGVSVTARYERCTQSLKKAGADDWIRVIDSKLSEDRPNMFSPNGDNRNEVFVFEAPKSMRYFYIVIYNRWGSKVHEIELDNMQNPQEEWSQSPAAWNGLLSNGAEASTGTYFYVLKARGYDDVPYEFHGSLLLVR